MVTKQASGSLVARHEKDCALGAYRWTAAGHTGCDCKPGYYVAYRDEDGKQRREAVGRNRKEADRALVRLLDKADDVGGQHRRNSNVTFTEWADEWYQGLARTANTRRSYKASLDYGKAAFGNKAVRSLNASDVRSYLTHVRKQRVNVTDETLGRHLRVLHACLAAAVPEYAEQNPVRLLHKSHRPEPVKKQPVYFTDAELPRLWQELPSEQPAAVYLYLCKTAVTTGMRMGELLALRWQDVRLADSEIRVHSVYVQGTDADGQPIGEVPRTKSGKPRTIDLTPDAKAVLEQWYTLSSDPGADDELVFPAYDGSHLVNSTITRGVLYPAMARAGIAREGEHQRKRDFRAFRNTFARIALQDGRPITWVQKQLGHSSITLTVDRYGSWERKAEKEEAAKIKAGTFPV